MTVIELKARVYDLIALKEQAQNEINQLNQQIAEEYAKQKEVPKEE